MAALSAVRGVNRTDAQILLLEFGTIRRIMQATPEQLVQCKGLGAVKAKRLYNAFRCATME